MICGHHNNRFLFALMLCLPAQALAGVWAGEDSSPEAGQIQASEVFFPSGSHSPSLLISEETDGLTLTAGEFKSAFDCVPLNVEEGDTCSLFSGEPEIWSRSSLTNELFGLQAPLAEQGIGYQAYFTQFYQGVATGGQEQKFGYGGKVDQFLTLESSRLGLWEGTIVSLHAETRYGQASNFDAVGLAPVNANMLYPASEPVTSITGLTISQMLSEEWMVSVGTFNQLDLFAQLYPQTGRGIDGFMNMSALAPLSLSRPLNLSMLGAGITKLNAGRVQGALSVFNTANAATNSSFNQLFENGAVILGYYRIFTNFGDLPGSHALLGVYSSGTYTSVDPTTWVILPPLGVVPGQETGTWSLTYFYEKKLWIDPHDSRRNLDLLTSWGISDGNPSPISWAGNVAVQGTGLNRSRPQDAVGVSYFHTSLSSDFRQLASPVLTLRDVNGVELYYNAAVTPWFHLTPDLQIVTPADRSLNTAIVVGLRGKITL